MAMLNGLNYDDGFKWGWGEELVDTLWVVLLIPLRDQRSYLLCTSLK
jgi:hypothetical protein